MTNPTTLLPPVRFSMRYLTQHTNRDASRISRTQQLRAEDTVMTHKPTPVWARLRDQRAARNRRVPTTCSTLSLLAVAGLVGPAVAVA